MARRLANADSRRFLDEFPKVRISRFRAMGVVDPKRHHAVIPFPNGKSKLLSVYHRHFPSGGGWSLFLCPGCSRRTPNLWLIDDAARCWTCCDAMNIKARNRYGFGVNERRRYRDKALDELQAKLESGERLRLKPNPPSWRGRAQTIYHSQSLTNLLRRGMISLRLGSMGHDKGYDAPLKLTRAYRPSSQALAVIPELAQVWKARTYERLEQALDQAHDIVSKALDSDDPQRRLAAAKILTNSKEGRARGFGG